MTSFDLIPTVFAAVLAVSGSVAEAAKPTPAPVVAEETQKPKSCLNDAARAAWASKESYSGPKGVVKPCVAK